MNTAPLPYKNQYLLYNRKSTDDADNQKNSISYQKMEGIRFAKQEHLSIAPVNIPGFCMSGIISEKHTGFKEDENFIIREDGTVQFCIERPKFLKLVSLLYKGEYKGVIFLCWDRASRNKSDDTIIRKLMKQGVDIRFVQTNYDKSSSGELHMDIDGVFAHHYSRMISEKVTNTMRKLRDEGVFTSRAPVGYLNLGDSGNKPFDEARAPLVQQLFEKYAEGSWSLSELAKWANNQGLTMPPMRRNRTEEEMLSEEELVIEPVARPITFKSLQKILINPFYIGKMMNSHQQYISSISHKALITEALFYQVQEMLKRKQVSVNYIQKPYFPYRGLIRCPFCKRVYTPYEQRGIHYYGARCEKECPNTKKNINAAFIEEKIGEALSGLYYTESELNEIDQRIQTDINLFEEQRKKSLEENEGRKKKIIEDISYLRENKLILLKTGLYTPESYLNEEMQLNVKLEKICIEEQVSHVSMHEVIKDTVLLSELLKDAYFYYCIAKPDEKRKIILRVFSELFISQNMLEYKCKKGFKVFEKPLFTYGAPQTWISELVTSHESIKQSIEELQEFSPLKQAA